ncbi:MAG TPA: hypothetical protein ENK57_06460 [Polyangiaceae bacterium]|nr:hypothetical protein [Polyangiaceae bacterium]
MRLLLGIVALLVALGLGGCQVHPLTPAVATSNTAARVLAVTHGQMAAVYEAQQVAAAKAAATKPEKRAAVQQVRERWDGAWDAYRVARATWVSLVAFLRVAIELGDGAPLDTFELAALLTDLVEAQQQLAVDAEPFIGIPPIPQE